MLSTVNEWITKAQRLIAKEVHIPLINDCTIDMTDELVDAWMYSDNDLRAAIDNILSRDPDHIAARFVALNFYYRLLTLDVPEKDEEVEDHRQMS